MAETTPDIPSAAQISGHPIHPMLVSFPIAYLVGALATDIAYLATQDPFWADASVWLIRAGLVMGVLAAIFGLTDFLARPKIRAHRIAWHHFIGNAIVLALAAVNLVGRGNAPMSGVEPSGVALSLITVAVLVYTGWLGGEMAYRHRIGAIPAGTPRVERAARGGERRMGPNDRRTLAA